MKVSILTMDGGNGTISASFALKEWLDGRGVDCSVVDFIRETDLFANLLANGYNRLLRGDLGLASLYMELAQLSLSDIYALLNAMARRKAAELLERERPDVAVLISPWIIGPVLQALKVAGDGSPRVMTVVVDLGEGMPEQWWNPGVDLTVLPTAEARDYLAGRGLQEGKGAVLGMPISPSLMDGGPSKEQCIKRLGVEGPLCAVLGGREGGRNSLEIADLLLRERTGANVLVQCGRNQPLLKAARRRNGLAAVGYVDSMAELYAASDVVITKPGALTVSELVALKKPFILDAYPTVMPQERGNVGFVERHGLGLVARRHEEIPGMVRSILDGGERFGEYDIYGTPRIGAAIMERASGAPGRELGRGA